MIRSRLFGALVACAVSAFPGAAAAMDDAALGEVLERRIAGDMSGACIAAAVVDGGEVARARRCADPADNDRIGPDVAFEIGSITKSMAGILLADLVNAGKASLDDPLANHLPEGTQVPEYEGQPILLRHLVTHTAGLPRLPSRMSFDNTADPYAALTPEILLASLQDVTLAQAPGEKFEYSNFGTMLLSLVLSREAGMAFGDLAEARLFGPLGMHSSFVGEAPQGVRLATGHLPGGAETPHWTFAPELGAVGAVRSTLDDMVRYARAQLGGVEESLGAAIALAQQPIPTGADQPMAMNWLLLPLGERMVHAHNGGTHGFSSMMIFDLEGGRASVVLADTGLAAFGGVDDVAAHLLNERIPLAQPRRAVERPADAPSPQAGGLADYVGTYALMPGFELVVSEHDGVLHAQATGQGAFPLAPMAADTFAAAEHGIEIEFFRGDDGEVTRLDLRQGGNTLSGERRPTSD